MSAAQPRATATATLQQREHKLCKVDAEILIIEEDVGSSSSDDTTLRLQSTDGWADDDDDEEEEGEKGKNRLTEVYRDVNELEAGIQSLQREMGLLLGMGGGGVRDGTQKLESNQQVTKKVDAGEAKEGSLKSGVVRASISSAEQLKFGSGVVATIPSNSNGNFKPSTKPIVANAPLKFSQHQKAEELRRRPTKVIMRLKPEPLVERRTVEKHPRIFWTIKEQAREFRKYMTVMMDGSGGGGVDKSKEVALTDMAAETRQRPFAPQSTPSQLKVEKVAHFCTKARNLKKGREHETAMLKVRKEVKKEVAPEQNKNSTSSHYEGPLRERSDSVEKPDLSILQSRQIPVALKQRSKSRRFGKEERIEEEEIETRTTNNNDNNDRMSGGDAKHAPLLEVVEQDPPPDHIDADLWLQVRADFGALPFEVQLQVARTLQKSRKTKKSNDDAGDVQQQHSRGMLREQRSPPPKQQHLATTAHQTLADQQFSVFNEAPNLPAAAPRHKLAPPHMPAERRNSQAVIGEVDRLLLTQAIIADMEHRVVVVEGEGGGAAENEEEEPSEQKKSIGGMMKRLLTQKKKKQSPPKRKSSSNFETPSLSSYGSFGQMFMWNEKAGAANDDKKKLPRRQRTVVDRRSGIEVDGESLSSSTPRTKSMDGRTTQKLRPKSQLANARNQHDVSDGGQQFAMPSTGASWQHAQKHQTRSSRSSGGGEAQPAPATSRQLQQLAQGKSSSTSFKNEALPTRPRNELSPRRVSTRMGVKVGDLIASSIYPAEYHPKKLSEQRLSIDSSRDSSIRSAAAHYQVGCFSSPK